LSENTRSPAYFAVIPSNVRYHTALTPNAKLLYGEITALADQTGYCWASNKYLASQFRWGERTVSRLIAQMQELELIRIEMVSTKTGQERRIYVGQIVAGGIVKIGDTPSSQNWRGGIANIGDQNNITEYIPPYNPPKTKAPKASSPPPGISVSDMVKILSEMAAAYPDAKVYLDDRKAPCARLSVTYASGREPVAEIYLTAEEKSC